ncbi:6-phospho-3-hexuloisomerase [uncultured Propionibacterium sp.]|uniref:6-phospho-3-hexuloisomerase n=1 Tax=uncultured Propionibacterium sp. TaxID=218066 RepID=UPI0029300304|nr:6-phospho-3-hexuloisomerase [uncultured Propionibacterium sp.]
MSDSSPLLAIVSEISTYAARVDPEQITRMAELLAEAPRVFVAGAGRTGFASRGFANRLMHLGRTAYFVGEPTTPSIRAGDVLLVGSGSGTTGSLVVMAERAKSLGARVATVTMFPGHRIGELSEVVLTLPGSTPKRAPGEAESATSIQPMGSLFEELCWLAFDALVLELMPLLGQSAESMFDRHANLE